MPKSSSWADDAIADILCAAQSIATLPIKTKDEEEQIQRALTGLREAEAAIKSYRYLTGLYGKTI